jgi:hypothetical protein
VIGAKKEGVTLTVETQSDKYTKGLPAGLPRWSNPLPFAYQTTGIETRYHAALFMEATHEPPKASAENSGPTAYAAFFTPRCGTPRAIAWLPLARHC